MYVLYVELYFILSLSCLTHFPVFMIVYEIQFLSLQEIC